MTAGTTTEPIDTSDAASADGSAKLLSGRCWTAPALQDGRLYLRSLDTAVCIDLGK